MSDLDVHDRGHPRRRFPGGAIASANTTLLTVGSVYVTTGSIGVTLIAAALATVVFTMAAK
jgi:hypothetical protein